MQYRRVFAVVFLQLGVIAALGIWIHDRATTPRAIPSAAFERSGDSEIPSSTARYYGLDPGRQSFRVLFETRPEDPAPVTDYILDENGFNETRAYEISKPPDTFRVVAMGDSHTFGLFVSPEENYPAQLERIFAADLVCGKRMEVVNIGVPGHDAELSVEHLRRRGLMYAPDLIVWWLKYDDLAYANAYFGSSSDVSGIAEIGERVLWGYSLREVQRLRDLFAGPIIIIKGGGISERPVLDELLERALGAMGGVRMVREPKHPKFLDGHPLPEGHAHIARKVADLLREESLICTR